MYSEKKYLEWKDYRIAIKLYAFSYKYNPETPIQMLTVGLSCVWHCALCGSGVNALVCHGHMVNSIFCRESVY